MTEVIAVGSAFIAGGVVGAIAKDKILGESKSDRSKQNELDALYRENEKLSRRNKDMEREIEDLESEISKAKHQLKMTDDNTDDLEDDLDKAKRELKKLQVLNDDLSNKVREYQLAFESQKLEITRLKEQIVQQ